MDRCVRHATMPRLHQAETALHNGDAGPRMAMWCHDESVTLFGGVMGGSGWADIEPIFQRLGASFSRLPAPSERRGHRGAAGDDLAYIGRLRAHHRRRQRRPSLGVRAALSPTVFRREDDEWKVVHRHADAVGLTRRRRPPPAAHISGSRTT